MLNASATCEKVATVWSLAERHGKERERRRTGFRRGGFRGKNDGEIGESHRHNSQHCAAAAQQHGVSNTTTVRGRGKKCPHSRDRRSSGSSRVKINDMSIRGSEAAKGGHQSLSALFFGVGSLLTIGGLIRTGYRRSHESFSLR